jgi:hypothetical protein
MKNFLLKSLFKFQDKPFWHIDYDVYDVYSKMQNLSIKSFEKNLSGDWELIYVTETVQSTGEGFSRLMKKTQEIWYDNYPCNILFSDPDTLCIKPLNIFGRFSEFRMFSTLSEPIEPHYYWNCGVRYFPTSLTSVFWNNIDRYISNWDYDTYDYEQTCYKDLMWSQAGLRLNRPQHNIVEQYIDSYLIKDLDDFFNSGCSIIHCHASREPRKTLEILDLIWRESLVRS